MTIVFLSNFLNHHQVPFCEAINMVDGVSFYFVELQPMPESFKKTGYPDFSDKDYLVRAWKDSPNQDFARQLTLKADVALFGSDSLEYEALRSRETDKLSFEVSERWLKKGLKNILSPRFIKSQWYYHTLFHKKPIYKLCSSAYGAWDQYKFHSYIDRCFKWGYFPKSAEFDIEQSLIDRASDELKIIWCARMIDWKHPEIPVLLAERLKKSGTRFHIDMYGDGVLKIQIANLIKQKQLSDVVSLKGNVPNDQILSAMREHDIFLFTSDRQEGWGAVANEAMANGCVLVGSNEIGSVPFLVKDEINGLVFRSCNIDSLFGKVMTLINNPEKMRRMAKEGYYTIKNVWNAERAATSFMQLVIDLQAGKDTSIKDGPCSKATPIN